MSLTRICGGCKQNLTLELFSKNKLAKDGLQTQCKACNAVYYQRNKPQSQQYQFEHKAERAAYMRQWHEDNKEYVAAYTEEYRQTHPEIYRNAKRRQYSKNPQKIKDHVSRWRKNNPDKVALQRQNNREHRNELRRKQHHEVLKFQPSYFLPLNLRNRLRVALKKNFKKGSAVEDLGCSIAEFRVYLESLFTEGMRWDNYGRGNDKWQIDHHMPLSAFNLEDRQHHLLASHYLNLRPMWSVENNRKHKQIPELTA